MLNIPSDTKSTINGLVKKHDKSKYSEEEFEGYRQFFFPTKKEEKNKELFDVAWNHHNKRNPHHWQYWILYNNKNTAIKVLEMPLEYILEMICDWISMSVKFNNLPSTWYEENREKILLADKTKEIVEKMLGRADMAFVAVRNKVNDRN